MLLLLRTRKKTSVPKISSELDIPLTDCIQTD